MSIFLSIASYCDQLLGFTIARALDAASDPDALRFGVVDQTDTPLASPPSTYLHLPPSAARGPCWARALAMSFYSGEDWFLQIDSHSDFDQGWDAALIDQARSIGRPNIAFTAYPAPLTFDGGKPIHGDNAGAFVFAPRPDWPFQPGSAVLKFHAGIVKTRAPIPSIHFGGCAFFAPGHFAAAFPYDSQLYFFGEEQTMFLRLYTHGWDVFNPVHMPIYHQYTDVEEVARPLHWDQYPDLYARLNYHSQARLIDFVNGKDLGVYGLGKIRTLADYAAFSGIDYERRTIERAPIRLRA